MDGMRGVRNGNPGPFRTAPAGCAILRESCDRTDSPRMSRFIHIKGAREHNLKNLDVRLPRDQLVVITGLSGSEVVAGL